MKLLGSHTCTGTLCFETRLSECMHGVLGHDSALKGYTRPGTTWANGMKFVMNHTPGVASIARSVDQQSSALPLYHRYPSNTNIM